MAAPGVVPADDSFSVPSVKGENLSGADAPGGMDQTTPAMASAPMTRVAPAASRSRSTATVIPRMEPSSSTLATTMDAGSSTSGSRPLSSGLE